MPVRKQRKHYKEDSEEEDQEKGAQTGRRRDSDGRTRHGCVGHRQIGV